MDDTLTIDIESTNEAGSGIDSLIAKLEALKVRVNENLKAIGKLNGALIRLGANSKNINFGNVKTPNVPNPTNPSAGSSGSTQPTDNAPTKAMSVWDKLKSAIAGTSAEANKAGRPVDDLGKKGEEAGEKTKQGADKATNALKRTGNEARRTSTFLSKIGGAIKTITLSPFTSLFKTLPIGKKQLTEVGNAVESLSKKLRMTTLALLGARGAFTAIRKAVNAYMQYDTALATTLQNNWAVLGSLIAPIIERLIALFSKLIAYIATFIKMLTGVDLVARANAKALKSQASGASGASKAVKDLSDELGNLQKFDDLNVVDFPKDTGGGAGGGAGAGAGLPTLAIDEIDTKPLERFLDFIKRNDWYGLGMEIARAFNDGLRLIDFDWLEQKARQWGKNMGDLFNGLTDGTDWNLVGEKIAGGLNTAMGFVNTFFDTYNFDHLGEGLATGINGLVNTIHWDDVGQFLTNKFKAMWETLDSLVSTLDFENLGASIGTALESAFLNIDFGKGFAVIGKGIAGLGKALSGFINNVDWATVASDFSTKLINGLKEGAKALQSMDWAQLGDDLMNAIKTTFANIDWIGLAESLAEFIGSALGGVTAFLLTAIGNLVTEIIESIKNYFGEYIANAGFEDDGANIIAGIFNGIIDAIKNVGKWIYDHIFKPFIDGFKKAFGIASPSKVMAEQGGYIIDGFFEGVKGIWDKVRGVFEDLKTKITNVFKGIQDFAKTMWNNFKATIGTISGFVHEKIIDPITSAFKTLWENMKKGASNAWDGIKSIFSSVASFFKNIFTDAWTAVKNVFSTGGKIFDGIKEGILDTFKAIVNKLIDGINTVVKIPFEGINKALNKIRNIEILDYKPFSGLWGQDPIKTPQIPHLSTGTNKIEAEGLYHLHQGEAVVPKKYNPAVNNKMYSENNAQMATKLDTLIDLINNMQVTNVVNIGDEELYNRTTNYVNRQSDVYGTSNW